MQNSQTPIKLLDEEWTALMSYIVSIEGPRAAISWVLKRDKGWTYRRPYYGDPVDIDFWTDNAKSMFLLSYSHLITKSLKLFNKNNG